MKEMRRSRGRGKVRVMRTMDRDGFDCCVTTSTLLWKLSATGDLITRRVRTHTYIKTAPGYTHTHTHFQAKLEKKQNSTALACPLLLPVLIDLAAHNLLRCVCVCVCV